MAKKATKRIAVWVIICFGLVATLCVLTIFNPMQFAFFASFEVVNQTGQAIEIVPIGMWEGSGKYGPLPRYRNSFPPAIPIFKHGILLNENERAKITYDSDDINFRHILIKDSSGKLYILDTDKRGSKKYAYPPEKKEYAILPLSKLRAAPSELIPCFSGATMSYSEAKEYDGK